MSIISIILWSTITMRLQYIGKRSCSCEAIPLHAYTWNHFCLFIGWVSYALTRSCICM
jgi:hypothetical protein